MTPAADDLARPPTESTEKMLLADLSHDPLIDLGVWLQGWPISAGAWRNPEDRNNPWLIRAMQRDGKVIADVTG